MIKSRKEQYEVTGKKPDALLEDYAKQDKFGEYPVKGAADSPMLSSPFGKRISPSMESDSCHSSVVNVIYNLRKKIEPDCKNPFYLKTVLGVGCKFSADSVGK